MIELKDKVCRICKLSKSPTHFSPKKTSCKVCIKEYDLQRRYGISQKMYDDMLSRQMNSCAICSRSTEEVGTLVVDHDHSCCPGRKTCGLCVRSLLCGYCNRGLGLFFDDPNLLMEAYNYLFDYKYKGENVE